jgi:hypothetical protein
MEKKNKNSMRTHVAVVTEFEFMIVRISIHFDSETKTLRNSDMIFDK